MDNCNNCFNFDFADAVIIRECIGNIKIGNVRTVQYGEEPSVSARLDGEKIALDFVLPLPEGCTAVDSAMSNYSTNPVSNNVLKSYIDENKSTFTKIFVDKAGKTEYSYSSGFSKFDFLICYASPTGSSAPMSSTVAVKYISDAGVNLEMQVADDAHYAKFVFHPNGFYSSGYSGSTAGKIYALYGVKI